MVETRIGQMLEGAVEYTLSQAIIRQNLKCFYVFLIVYEIC